ncbi:MAG: ribosome-associated translation inhibitor RaiA [Terriglobia bacterium]
MRVEYTGRQIEVTPAIQKFTEDHLQKIRKILGESIEVHVILTVEKYRHIAEMNLKSNSFSLNGLEETNDMYSSINTVLEKLERQALKTKRPPDCQEEKGKFGRKFAHGDSPEGNRAHADPPRIIKSESYAAKPMTVEEAAMEVSNSKTDFLVFRNAESDKVSVVYRRKDGNFGLIEP